MRDEGDGPHEREAARQTWAPQHLAAYLARGEAGPAYQRAFEAQLAVFNSGSSPSG